MAPVTWRNGWPVIDLGGEKVPLHMPTPGDIQASDTLFSFGGNFSFIEDFTEDALAYHFLFLRTPKESWYQIQDGQLVITTRQQTVSGAGNPGFIGHRQQHLRGVVSTKLQFHPRSPNEKAGLCVFQNESHYYYLCRSSASGKAVVQLYQSSDESMRLIAESLVDPEVTIRLRIEADRHLYHFSWAQHEGDWISLKRDVDATFLSTKTAGGFVGCIYGMYTTSLQQESSNSARFDWFKYVGEDEELRSL